jgi:hypothetical protein
VGGITPAEVLALLRKVEALSALEIAKRLRQTMSAIFRFSVPNGWATSDRAALLADAMKSAPRQPHRTALKEGELGSGPIDHSLAARFSLCKETDLGATFSG